MCVQSGVKALLSYLLLLQLVGSLSGCNSKDSEIGRGNPIALKRKPSTRAAAAVSQGELFQSQTKDGASLHGHPAAFASCIIHF